MRIHLMPILTSRLNSRMLAGVVTGAARRVDVAGRGIRVLFASTTCFILCLGGQVLRADGERAARWDSRAAATYLDQRTTWWMHDMGAMDHGTFCVSCHTGFAYALARTSLRAGLGEHGPSPTERQLLDSVTKRIRLWTEVQPYLNNKGQGPSIRDQRSCYGHLRCPERHVERRHAPGAQNHVGSSAKEW